MENGGAIQTEAELLEVSAFLASAEQLVGEIDPECSDQTWMYYNPNGSENEYVSSQS